MEIEPFHQDPVVIGCQEVEEEGNRYFTTHLQRPQKDGVMLKHGVKFLFCVNPRYLPRWVGKRDGEREKRDQKALLQGFYMEGSQCESRRDEQLGRKVLSLALCLQQQVSGENWAQVGRW